MIEDAPQEEVQNIFSCMTTCPSKNDIIKLHRQIGHCTESRLLKLIESSKFGTSVKDCERCIREL